MTSLLKRLLRFLNSYFFYKCTFSIKYTVMWCSSSYTSHWKSKQIMKSAAWLISTLHSQQLDWFLHCILSSLIEFFHVIYLASLQYSLAWSITNSIARSISTQSISMQLISNFYTINLALATDAARCVSFKVAAAPDATGTDTLPSLIVLAS